MFRSNNQDQIFLLPPSVRELIGQNSVCPYFIKQRKFGAIA
jgi:hypothetical protein